MTTKERAARTYAVYQAARTAKGYTDYYVSQQAGVRKSGICDWKHQRYTPKHDKLARIAKVLEIPVEMFEVD